MSSVCASLDLSGRLVKSRPKENRLYLRTLQTNTRVGLVSRTSRGSGLLDPSLAGTVYVWLGRGLPCRARGLLVRPCQSVEKQLGGGGGPCPGKPDRRILDGFLEPHRTSSRSSGTTRPPPSPGRVGECQPPPSPSSGGSPIRRFCPAPARGPDRELIPCWFHLCSVAALPAGLGLAVVENILAERAARRPRL